MCCQCQAGHWGWKVLGLVLCAFAHHLVFDRVMTGAQRQLQLRQQQHSLEVPLPLSVLVVLAKALLSNGPSTAFFQTTNQFSFLTLTPVKVTVFFLAAWL
jgi:hypothetical protein